VDGRWKVGMRTSGEVVVVVVDGRAVSVVTSPTSSASSDHCTATHALAVQLHRATA